MTDKSFYQSKGKIGAILLAAGAIFTAAGGVMNGTLDAGAAINQAWPLVAGALGIYGIRDAQN